MKDFKKDIKLDSFTFGVMFTISVIICAFSSKISAILQWETSLSLIPLVLASWKLRKERKKQKKLCEIIKNKQNIINEQSKVICTLKTGKNKVAVPFDTEARIDIYDFDNEKESN